MVQSSRPFIESLALEDYPAFSPNGGLLAYASGDAGAAHKIYLHNLAGGEAVRLTNDLYDDVSPSWSSDGGEFVYIGSSSGCPLPYRHSDDGASRAVPRSRTVLGYIAQHRHHLGSPVPSFAYFAERSGLSGDKYHGWTLTRFESKLVAQNRRVNQLIYSLIRINDGKTLAFMEHGRGIYCTPLPSGSERLLNQALHLNVMFRWPGPAILRLFSRRYPEMRAAKSESILCRTALNNIADL